MHTTNGLSIDWNPATEEKKKRMRETSESLDAFLQNIYFAEDMTQDQSRKAIENSIVELTLSGKHLGNGLLITKNGYFVTAKHCLMYGVPDLTIRTASNYYAPVELLCARSKDIDSRTAEDLVLLKADLRGPNEALKYTIHAQKELPYERVFSIGRWDGQTRFNLGNVIKNHNSLRVKQFGINYRNHALINMSSIPGDSGSTIVGLNGRFFGILSTSGINMDITGCSKAYRALELISIYSQYLKQV